jgi:tetratricopeptide (TPR) repeat protein
VWHVSQDLIDESLALATQALLTRQQSPSRSVAIASDVISRPDVSAQARLVALWAMGLAERELSNLDRAEDCLREAMAVAHQIGDSTRLAEVSSALVVVLTARGQPAAALALADSIDGLDAPTDLADLDMRRALALEQLGRLPEALDAYTRALAVIEAGDDRVLEARVRCNRSIVLVYQGDTERALRDAEIAEALAIANGQVLLAAGAAHNRGFIAGRRGDIVTALAAFEHADRLYAEVGYPGRFAGLLASDRCEVMMVAGLHDEARESAELAVRSLAESDDVTDLAEAHLLLARACLAQGDAEAAHRAALDALERFNASGRTGWATMAEYLAVRAAPATRASQHGETIGRASDLAQRLDALGWTTEAVDVHIATAEMALGAGDPDTARRHLDTAAQARHRGSPDRRANAWLATAMLRRTDGNTIGAKRALGAGLRLLAEHQATLGATDLRASSTVHARGLIGTGLQMALESGRPRDVLQWAERARANSLDRASPSRDAHGPLASSLAELRRARAELDDARRALQPDATAELRVRRQEQSVRDLARIQPGWETTTRQFAVRQLQSRLGADRVLVEYVEVGGALSAVVIDERRCQLRHLGEVTMIRELVDDTVFSLGRMARVGASDGSLRASRESLDETLTKLDDLLLRPLGLRDVRCVVVPTGALHSVPWGGLPSVRSRDLVIAMSAARWAATEPRAPFETVAVISGPDLAAADEEAATICSLYDSARTLSGPRATVTAALDLLAEADIAHITCHGHFRADSPMFSSLTMYDGPLTVYDLEGLRRPPAVVVLPACAAGRTAVGVGDELIGTASALLGIGVRTVIAPITVVNDTATVQVMELLHRRLRTGSAPGEALAHVRDHFAAHGDAACLAASIAMLCLE